jgi:hypothetical protein
MAVHQRRIHNEKNADTNNLQVLMHRDAQKQREGIMKAGQVLKQIKKKKKKCRQIM